VPPSRARSFDVEVACMSVSSHPAGSSALQFAEVTNSVRLVGRIARIRSKSGYHPDVRSPPHRWM